MTHLSCDDVFEILTRAPFPTGDRVDLPVEQHLSVCHDCRQLAEALRPATDLFAEVLSAEEQNGLPTYRGATAVAVMDVVTKSETQPARTSTGISQLRGGLIPAIGLVLLLMIAVTRGPGAPGNARNQLPLSPPAPESTADTLCLMAGITLPADCVPLSAVGPVIDAQQVMDRTHQAPRASNTHLPGTPHWNAANPHPHRMQALVACQSCHDTKAVIEHRHACCTSCHQANVDRDSKRPPVPRLIAACSTCHS